MRIAIAIALIAAMAAAAAILAVSLLGKGRKGAEGAQASAGSLLEGSENAGMTTQDLVQVAGFDGNCAVALDGTRVIFIHVEGKNLSFATAEERDMDAERLGNALAAQRNPYRIHRCQRPIDTTIPMADLKHQIALIEEEMSECAMQQGFSAEKRMDALRERKALIEDIYLPQAAGGGDTKYETDVYITMGFEEGPRAGELAMEKAAGFIALLSMAGYAARIMKREEIVERLVNYYGRFPTKAEQLDPYCNHEMQATRNTTFASMPGLDEDLARSAA